jgi:hypothetical protein
MRKDPKEYMKLAVEVMNGLKPKEKLVHVSIHRILVLDIKLLNVIWQK